MIIDLMYFEGCPNWRETADHLEALRQVRGDFEVRLIEVTTPEAADEWRFHGSPVGLSCRTYVTDQGIAGSPTRDQLSRAIVNASRATPNVE
jgi:hypothetical protein